MSTLDIDKNYIICYNRCKFSFGYKFESDNMKSKRSTILIAALMAFLCISLCVGVTLAFFSDTATNGNNKVKAGKLKVDLEVLDKNNPTEWISIKADKQPIFHFAYWEPGYTDVKILKVENEGTLAIKWEAQYASQKNDVELANVINVYVKISDHEFSYPSERNELSEWNDWNGTLSDFIVNISTVLSGILQAGDSAYFGIALQMQMVDGTEYQGLSLANFDLHIVATQVPFETDAFDDRYDGGSTYPCLHTKTAINVIKEPNFETDAVGIQQTVCVDCKEILKTEDCYTALTYVKDSWRDDYYVVSGLVGNPTGTNLVIPDTYGEMVVQSISNNAFANESQITSVTISKNIKSIGEGAFKGCTSLTNIEIPDSVTSIGRDAFHDCTSLTEIDLPSNLSGIAISAFQGCTALESIDIPDSVKTIANYAFYGCRSLKNIELPDNLVEISFGAFEFCTSLTSIEFPDGLKTINQYAFYGCSSLKSIEIPDSVTSIILGAFQSCTALTSVKLSQNLTAINTYVFHSCKSLTDIEIPDSVTSIGQGAFNGCSSLESIDIPDGVTSIGISAFSGCKALKSIEFPVGITVIEGGMFGNCAALTSFKIPDGVTSIGNSAFSGCTALLNVEIPDSVASIGSSAFYNCQSLTSILIPNGITEIANQAFWNCKSLTYVNIPDSVTTIGNQAFQNCANVTQFEIGEDSQLTSIGTYAFFNCEKITGILIPSGVTSIGALAFSNCPELTSIMFENPIGWWYTEEVEATEGETIAEDLSNLETAATCLRVTYASAYLHRAELETE